ncbi:hypothetical protein H2199_004285 [Coniosporium tulheliwenetii]|uniref:Uncharacterized protein n=1 Tax=Coniosporium tulheliwenetii TaxID=3383036 RepID=A0ACC2Z8M2_9PEZI|nr:hypothetical protein H2199_004285 [Cladosporium sp. JES 115]
MIILIRHAQSEGNKNRDIHQFVPDHRVKLTPDGWQQAEEAGRRLRSMLKPDDTLQFFTSPYRRTRETTEGILKSLSSDEPTPSPFPRHKIKVFEEPRLREQDFGNFQPCSAEMERMWQERADYGHFFYRIPNGESAADAYDRISGFNETAYRYHWSVEYFEDLRNVNHCEFVIMKQNPSNGKYVLQNELRTWSDLKKRAAALQANANPSSTSTTHRPSPPYASPKIPTRRWGGCVNGCNHDHSHYPRRPRRQTTADPISLPSPAIPEAEKADHPIAALDKENVQIAVTNASLKSPDREAKRKGSVPNTIDGPKSEESERNDDADSSSPEPDDHQRLQPNQQRPPPEPLQNLHPGRDFGGSMSGAGTPGEGFSDDSDYFPSKELAARARGKEKPSPRKRRTNEEMMAESGMGAGARAEKLGDGAFSATEEEVEGMKEREDVEHEVEEAKMKDRKGMSEVY